METVMIEGKEYDIEKIKQALKAFCEIWEQIKEVVLKAWKSMKEKYKEWIRIYCKVPGYRRKSKAHLLKYYEENSKGKSNNWRKMHGLHMRRRG